MKSLKNYIGIFLTEKKDQNIPSLDLDFYIDVKDLIKIKEYNIDENQLRLIYKCSLKKAKEIIEFFQDDDIYIIKPDVIKWGFDKKVWEKYKKEIKNLKKVNILHKDQLDSLSRDCNTQSVVNTMFGALSSDEEGGEAETSSKDKFLYKIINNVCQNLNIDYKSINQIKVIVIREKDVYLILTTKELGLNLSQIK